MDRTQARPNFQTQMSVDHYDYFHAEKYFSHGHYAHFHNNIEIYCVYEGSMTTVINDEEFVLHAGDAIVIDSLNLHRYVTQTGAEIGYVIIGSKYLAAFQDEFPGRALPVALFNKEANRPILDYICMLAAQPAGDIMERTAYSNLLLHYIVSAYGTREPTQHSEKQRPIIKIVRYIYDHANENLSLDSLSQSLGYARQTISHLLNKYIKIDLRNFINNIRIQNLIAMRADPSNKDKPTVELAYACGFNSAASFYRAYKKFGF